MMWLEGYTTCASIYDRLYVKTYVVILFFTSKIGANDFTPLPSSTSNRRVSLAGAVVPRRSVLCRRMCLHHAMVVFAVDCSCCEGTEGLKGAVQ